MAAPATHLRTLEHAFTQHEGFVRNRLRGLGVPTELLDDATQDVFEVLVRRIADYDPARPFVPWMSGVARKVARKHRDRAHRRPVELVRELATAERSDPERAAMTDEARQQFERFLGRLTPEQWEVFVLSEVEGLRGTEIAAELEVNLSTVYARLRKAKAHLHRTVGRRRLRWLPAWVPLFGGAQTKSGVAPLAAVAVVMAVAASAAFATCGEAPARDSSAPHDPPATDRAVAASSGVSTRAASPAGLAGAKVSAAPLVAPTPPSDGWLSAGSGVTTTATTTLSIERHYRIVGDTLEFRITYVGDDDEPSSSSLVEMYADGMEIVQRLPDDVEIAAGEVVEVVAKLRATRPGVVRWGYRHGTLEASSGADMPYVLEDGRLRECGHDECLAPARAVEPSGEDRTLAIYNTCRHTVRFAVLQEYGVPPEGTTLHSYAPGRRDTLTMDAQAQLVVVDDDGKPTMGLGANGNGDVRFDDDPNGPGCRGTVTDEGYRGSAAIHEAD
ncbi:MAG: sigma-70 family RNA polymerase sigma factor [Myxococcota bacterium]